MHDIDISVDGGTITVRIPIAFRARGGRKLMIAPDGNQLAPSQRTRIDSTLVRAIVKAFRWKEMLESGEYATVSEIARAENKNISYVSHVMRLTLLAPDLVEAILDGRQPPAMQLQPLMRGFPMEWEKQRSFDEGGRFRRP